jgi:hypothetical protein
MFKLKRKQLLAATLTAHNPNKADNGANTVPTGPQTGNFRPGVKILSLHAYPDHPPVTGGKNATSSPLVTRASGRAWAWLTAQRTRAGCSKARA